MRTQFFLAVSMVLFFVGACLFVMGGFQGVGNSMENWILHGQSPVWVMDGILGSHG